MIGKKMGVLIVVGALAVGMVFSLTQLSNVSAASSVVQSSTGVTCGDFPGMGWGHGGVDRESLAAALGISIEELDTAYQKAYEAALAQAVELGLITPEQADEFKTDGFGMDKGRHLGLVFRDIDFTTLLADALGISVSDLQAAYRQATITRIDQAVNAGKITQEQGDLMKGRYALHNDAAFQSAMQSAFQAAVQQAVADGVITQAQADLILQNAEGKSFGGMYGIGRGDFGPMGGMRGHGRHGGMRGFAPDGSAAPGE